MSVVAFEHIANNHDELLASFMHLCESNFGKENTDKWLSHLRIASATESEIIFAAPSKFMRDWIIREFLEVSAKKKSIRSLLQTLQPKLKKISIIHIFQAAEEGLKNDIARISAKELSTEKKIVNLSKYDNVFALGTELNQRFTFQNFVSAKYNKLAVSMARIAAGLDEQRSLFDDKIPLFIHGGVGIGKTHLAQAIAWQIKESDKNKKVVYLSAERFMYHFVSSIRNNDVMAFKGKMRSIDVLIVDDVQFIAGKESTQQEFMNCFNHLVEENKQVVLVCDRCPSDLTNVDEKLKSRISGGMIINFKTPDYADRLAILQAKIAAKEQVIADSVTSLIAEKIKTNVRDLEGVLNKLIAGKVLLDEEITVESAKTVLADYINQNATSQGVTIAKIQKTVAQFYEIEIADLISVTRQRSIARPRQIAMYLAKKLTCDSLPSIGKKFGGKNHATVIHSIKQVQSLMESDAKVKEEVKSLEEKLGNNG